ncbi:MAG: hypothetical protein HW397_110 [Dehalococcoidia bacterium]|nr:hypothetical protein [Dehalococcoidia bacterium]
MDRPARERKRMQSNQSPFENELQQYPTAVLTEFKKAEGIVCECVQPQEFALWVQEGIGIAQHSFRSWEAASEYFRASPGVVKKLNFAQVLRWAKWGRSLAADSPVISSAFFRSSPSVLGAITAEDFFHWASMGKTLYNGTWKSSSLCSTYYDSSPNLLNTLSLQELESLVTLIDLLSQKSYDAANDCLLAAETIFSKVDQSDRAGFLALGTTLTRENWRDLKAYLEQTPKVLLHLERSQRSRFLTLGERIARSQRTNVIAFLTDSAAAMGQIEQAEHSMMLSLAERLADVHPGAVGDFLKTVPQIHGRVKDDQLAKWFALGLDILRENEEGGLSYFRMESSKAEQAVESLSHGVELDAIQDVLQMYCRALAGEDVDLQAGEELKEKNIGWNSSEQPSTEGSHVYLPAFVERYESKEENFGWYKVIATHQAAHLEFSSFHFVFDRPSTIFIDHERRYELAPAVETNQVMSDIQRFFDLFQDRRLAADIFTLVEDSRLDHRVRREYRGLRNMYERVQREAVEVRPDPKTLPLREALMELLVRLSLEDSGTVAMPIELQPHIEAVARLVFTLRQPASTVEDSAEVTIRVYDVVRQVPNLEAPPEAYEDGELPNGDGQSKGKDLDEMLRKLRSSGGPGDGDAEQEKYDSPEKVDYRGDFKPELAQALANLKDQAMNKDPGKSNMPTAEDLKQMLQRSVEMEGDGEDEDTDEDATTFLSAIMEEAAKQKAKSNPNTSFPHVPESNAILTSNEPTTFLYDEWDFRAGDYKPRWCAIRERRMEDGTVEFFEKTLVANRALVSQIKRQFEMLAPQSLRKIKHLPDGEEYDFDAVVDSIIQARAGDSPSDKIYWRRNKVAREVACVFLLDMSASTAEAIDEGKKQFDSWDFPDDPKDYMTWLRSRRDEVNRRSYKRIIDVEKEGTVLLIKALEAIGDTYGIYGFSGYGRENVEFYVIKDLDEKFGDHVKKRIDRIAPMHATRMGPAIRHVTSKLIKQDARTKILFLLSDGRPQDRGYSREGVEKEYAVHDTRMALLEAKRNGIVPFCLTVDRAGHDYLKTMMSDMGYEILSDISSLPKRLPMLYRRLTV